MSWGGEGGCHFCSWVDRREYSDFSPGPLELECMECETRNFTLTVALFPYFRYLPRQSYISITVRKLQDIDQKSNQSYLPGSPWSSFPERFLALITTIVSLSVSLRYPRDIINSPRTPDACKGTQINVSTVDRRKNWLYKRQVDHSLDPKATLIRSSKRMWWYQILSYISLPTGLRK